jgi:hypothetical protein
MASALLAHVEVVKRLLDALEGAELARVKLEQSRALSAYLERIKVLTIAEKGALVAGIEVLRLDQTEKARLLTRVHGKSSGEARKRSMQDYVSWPSFCTPRIWQSIAQSPSLAVEILCQHMNSLGLINASKDTQKSLAAHAVTAELARSPFPVSEADAKRVFKAVGKRLKQLYKAEPLEYIVKLPPTPAVFLRSHPMMAKAAFARDNLPCVCPLDPAKVSDAGHKIQCRGGADKEESSSGQPTDMQQMMGFVMQFVSQLMANSPQLLPPGDGEVTLLPPGSLFRQASPASMKFQELTDRAVAPQQADAGLSMVAKSTASSDKAPPILEFLDAKPTEENQHVPPRTPSKAIAMRDSIMAARTGLAADRAAAAALVKAAKTQNNKVLKKITKKTGTPKKAAKQVEKPTPKKEKSKFWLKAQPDGCAKCRYVPGCTRSCYLSRGEKIPK